MVSDKKIFPCFPLYKPMEYMWPLGRGHFWPKGHNLNKLGRGPLGHDTYQMSKCMRFPTMWYVRQANPQISLRVRAVWSEPLLVAWVFYDCYTTDWTSFGISNVKRKLRRLVRVYTCQNVKLLEISCHGSNIKALGLMVSDKKIFSCFSLYKPM